MGIELKYNELQTHLNSSKKSWTFKQLSQKLAINLGSIIKYGKIEILNPSKPKFVFRNRTLQKYRTSNFWTEFENSTILVTLLLQQAKKSSNEL